VNDGASLLMMVAADLRAGIIVESATGESVTISERLHRSMTARRSVATI
jgi:hypothetical protein